MAQRATVLVENAAPVPKRAGRASRASAETSKPHAIAVDFRKLVQPYKKRGRLTLRVERMPSNARFSAGRNNGDNSWSFSLDELEDLEFLPAPGFEEPATIVLRIIAHDSSSATTVALLDYEISPDGAGTATEIPDVATNVTAMEQLRRLRDEMAEMARQLAERDADLEDTSAEAKDAQARLERARKAWQAEMDARVAEVQKEAAAERARAEEAWKKERDASLAAAEQRANAHAAEARAHTLREAEEARTKADRLAGDLEALRKALAGREAELTQLRANMQGEVAAANNAVRKAIATAETLWKAGEAARLASAEAQWREQYEQALAQAHAAAKKSSKTERGESVRLHGELAVLRTQLTERDSEMARLRASVASAQAGTESAVDSALGRAKELWKTEEAARFAAAEERWREQSERALIQAQAGAKNAEAPAETARLRDELAKIRKDLGERESELAQMQSALVQSRAQHEGALKAALARAEENWKTGEADRLAAAQAQWQEQSERALADARNSTGENQDELERQRKEAEELRQYLAKRDAEIEHLRATLASSEPKTEEAVRQALLKAEDIWKANEALRMTTAEARWRQEADRAHAEALDAVKKSEGEARAELEKLNGEIASLRNVLAEKDSETAQLRANLAEAEPKTQDAVREALAKAEESWKAAETARLAEAEAQWRVQSDQALARAREEAEKAIGDERSARERQSGEFSDLRKELGERDGEIAQLKTALMQAGVQRERDLQDAQETWKAGEAARLGAAEAQWQEKSAAMKAEHLAEHARVKAEAEAGRASLSSQHEAELQGLRGEIANLREMLTARDSELAQARKAATESEKRAAHDIDAARASAEREARERFQARLAEASARYEAAESALVEMRMRTGNHTNEDSSRLLDEINTLRTVLSNREAELAQFRHVDEEAPAAEAEPISFVHQYRGLIVAGLAAASIVMGGVLLWPQFVTLLPYDWQLKIYEMNGQVTTDDAPAPAPKVQAAAPAPLPQAVVVRGVNLRAEASTKSNVILTLVPGTDVSELETRGSWTRVRAPDAKQKPQEGWVFNTYLKAKGAAK